jgi:uncharacterized coiled-coil protein SlyX
MENLRYITKEEFYKYDKLTTEKLISIYKEDPFCVKSVLEERYYNNKCETEKSKIIKFIEPHSFMRDRLMEDYKKDLSNFKKSTSLKLIGYIQVVNNNLWKSYNGAVIAASDQMSIVPLSKYFQVLNPKETKKIVNAFELEMYDMGLEYAWSRAMKVLDSRLEYFGLDFISEMTERETLESLEQLSNLERIELAFELGMINSTAKIFLSQASQTLNHYLSREIADGGEEIEPAIAIPIVYNLTKYILGNEIEASSIEFKSFRDNLKEKIYQSSDNQIDLLKNSPYFYIKTTIRTILSLIKTYNKEKSASDLMKILNNATVFITSLWEQMFIEDKKLVGFTYAQSISDGYAETVSTFSTILDSVHGYDYVPETTRSTAYKKIAKELTIAHYGMNNFYNEPAYSKKLDSMGSVIPNFALQECLRAVIVSRIGNQYGTAHAAQSHNINILNKITTEQWKEFFAKLIIQDQLLLEKLAESNSDMMDKWFSIVEQYVSYDFNIENGAAQRLFEYSKKKKERILKSECKKILIKITG